MKRLPDFTRSALVIASACLIAFSFDVAAQVGMSGPKIEYKAVPSHTDVYPGEQVSVDIKVMLDSAWHVNSNKPLDDFLIPTELNLEATELLSIEGIDYPEHTLFKTGFQEEPLAVYEHEFTVKARVKVAENAPLGAASLKGALRYQACNDKQCAPPKNLPVEFTVNVIAAGTERGAAASPAPGQVPSGADAATVAVDAAAAPGDSVAPGGGAAGNWRALLAGFRETGRTEYASKAEFLAFIENAEAGRATRESLEGRGFFAILVAVLVGGFLLNLTPCVLPLIPINLAIIGAGARAGSKGRGFLLGGAYGLGISLVYGALGLLVVLGLSTAFGSINQSVWFNGAMVVLFVVLGLAMFDILSIDFSRFQAKLGIRKNEKGSFSIAFVMGAISALLAGACVAPMVITTIVYAQDQFSRGNLAALSLPFLLGVGMAIPWPFAGAGMSVMPKPGAWMNRVKQGLGVFILVLAAYYAHLAWSIYQQSNVDPAEVTASAAEADAHGWLKSLEAGLEQAKRENKPVLVDFWASWCKNCLVMNNTILKDEEVLARLDGYVKIKYQAEDPSSGMTKEVWEHFKLIGLPTYVILKPEG